MFNILKQNYQIMIITGSEFTACILHTLSYVIFMGSRERSVCYNIFLHADLNSASFVDSSSLNKSFLGENNVYDKIKLFHI